MLSPIVNSSRSEAGASQSQVAWRLVAIRSQKLMERNGKRINGEAI